MSCLRFDASSQEGGVLGSGLSNRLGLQTVMLSFAFQRFKSDHILFKCKFQTLSFVKVTAGTMESCDFEARKVLAEVFNCFA